MEAGIGHSLRWQVLAPEVVPSVLAQGQRLPASVVDMQIGGTTVQGEVTASLGIRVLPLPFIGKSDICWSYSVLFLQHLEQCQAHRRRSTDVCLRNELLTLKSQC